jgi:DNA-binding NarL/FixJ family response regulator
VTGHHTLRVSLRSLIDHQTDLTVGAEAADLTEARYVWDGQHLELAIVDRLVCASMEILRRALLLAKPGIPVILMTMDSDLAQTKAALAAGVRGIVAKQDVAGELIPAAREVLDGQRYVSSELLKGVADDVRAGILAGE